MSSRYTLLAAAIAAALVASVLVLPAAGAQSGGAYLDGAEPWTESDCAGDVLIVVGSDAKAQSDIYSAVTLAGVLDTDCVILAGPRDGDMPADQRARLDAAADEGGYVLGGTAAVPDSKVAGRDLTRLGGATRWETAQLIGSRARTLADDGEPDAANVPDTTLTAPSDVQQPGVFLDGAEPWIASDCEGEVPIVVGSDAKAQSDIYSAVTLAGVLGTDCVVLAGPRDGDMPSSQQTRLAAAESGGYVLGGTAAVPTAKITGRDMTRLGGATRWDTAQLVGRRASGDSTAGTSTASEPQEPENAQEADSESGIPDPVLPKQVYITYLAEVSAALEECGYLDDDRGGYRQCENPEDTQAINQMQSDFLGCEFNGNIGRCEGMSLSETWQLFSRAACPEGWSLSGPHVTRGEYRGELCYRHDHPDYRPM